MKASTSFINLTLERHSVEKYEYYSEENVFISPYESIWLRLSALVAYLTGLLVCGLLHDFIKNEVDEQKKTVCNLLTAYSHFLMIAYLLIFPFLDLIQAWIGPFPYLFCQLQNIGKTALLTSNCVTLFVSFVLRFFLIVIWTRMKIINDYLIARLVIRIGLFLGKHFRSQIG